MAIRPSSLLEDLPNNVSESYNLRFNDDGTLASRRNGNRLCIYGHTESIMRLLVKHRGVLRRVASIEIAKHDGSITLALVRSGSNTSGWHWDSTGLDYTTVEYSEPKPKTKRVTVHTSGRVNFHCTPNPGVNFIPCLLDLTEAVALCAYIVPRLDGLDSIEASSSDDHVIDFNDEFDTRLGFEFIVIPNNSSLIGEEVWRFIVEGRYGLACRLFSGQGIEFPKGVPPGAFTLIRPSSQLPKQQIEEGVAFLRFQQLMHENQVRQALLSSTIPEHVHETLVQEVVRNGRGIQGPNNEGVWEVVCSVPMRIRPELVVEFVDKRYQAEMIDITSTDRRLEKVRVRFRVYDQTKKKWVKHPVDIVRAFLNAEL